MADEESTRGQPAPGTSSDRALLDGMSALVRQLGRAPSGPDLLAALVQHLVRTLPADGAAAALLLDTDASGRMDLFPPATGQDGDDPLPARLGALQYQVVHEGPGLDAITTGTPQVTGAMGGDARWPRYGARLARLGIRSWLAVPLAGSGEVFGAIDLYAHAPDAFDAAAVALGSQFVEVVSNAVFAARLLDRERQRTAQLQNALVSREVIDQAIGILRSRSGDSAEDAFERLRARSQSEGVKLSEVARRLVEEAVRRAQSRHTGPASTQR